MKRPVAAAFAAVLIATGAGLAFAQPAMPPPNMDPAKVPAGHYTSDPHHTALTIRVQHMGMTHSTFRMNKVDAGFDYDPAKPAASKVTATIDANSFDQGDAAISTQFAKEFLDAPNHPTITFTSTAIKLTGGAKGTMTGDLTLHGVTKPVSLNLTFDGSRPASNFGPARVGFSATGAIKRSDFGAGGAMGGAVSDNVDLALEIEFVNK